MRTATIIAIAACLSAAAARAGTVQLLTDSGDAFAGVPFAVAIDVVYDKSQEAPQFPELQNATVELADTSQSSNSSFQITINGRRMSQSQQKIRYLYRITPQAPGTVSIPPISVQVDGETLRTRPAVVKVTKSETGDLLFVELKADKEKAYVGEPVDLTLEVWLRPFTGDGVRFDQNDMWRMIDAGASEFGPFAELFDPRKPKVTWRNDRRQDADNKWQPYIVYEATKQIYPERPGPVVGSDLRVIVNYPLRVGRSRSPFTIFDGPQVTQAKAIVGTVKESPLTIMPIPTAGRPSYYNGVVGPHTLSVSAAPTEAQVGDPITVTMVIAGRGLMDTLQAPRLADIPAITQQFQVANDPLPGVVEGKTKRFTQSLRALNADVSEVPAIPLVYFDTDREEFVTVYSNPIPLKITASERMSATQIVQASEPGGRSVDSLTHLNRGIESNYTDPGELLAQQGLNPGPAFAVVGAGCPLIYAACALLQRRRERYSSNTALRRRRGARREAQRALAQAAGNPDRCADVLLGYVADRLDLPAGGLTRQEAVRHLRGANVSAEVVTEFDNVLADCEAAQFGGGATSGADLEARVRKCLGSLVQASV
ncbi:MAG: BatD family protein [Phycisphaerales bacterium]|nr:BatD family protein [Phycisphaerales bacterium]